MSAIENTTTNFHSVVVESIKGMSLEELLTLISAASAEAKKAVKTAMKAPKEKVEKKGSMPKGVVPAQLHKPRAWVDFTLAHANKNGWEAFTVKGQQEQMPASVEKDGQHVFESTGKPMNNKQAMSLSKQRWAPKENTGTRKELYDEFEAGYVAPDPSAPVVPKEPKAPKEKAPKKEPKPKMTEEEKLAKKEETAAKKKADKAAKKAEEAVKAAEEAKKTAENLSPAPMKIEAIENEVKKAVAIPKKKKVVKEEQEFTCPDDGQVHPWDWKGKKLLRNFENQVWARTDEGEAGDWQGVYDPATKKIDDSVPEPEFEEEDDE